MLVLFCATSFFVEEGMELFFSRGELELTSISYLLITNVLYY